MQIRKFKAKTVKEAMDMVRLELGEDAIILKTKKVRETEGVGAILNSEHIEIFAALDTERSEANEPKPPAQGGFVAYNRRGRSFYSHPEENGTPESGTPDNRSGLSIDRSVLESMVELKNRMDFFFDGLDRKIETTFKGHSEHYTQLIPQLEEVQNELKKMKQSFQPIDDSPKSVHRDDVNRAPIGLHLLYHEVEQEIVESICRNLDPKLKNADPEQSDELHSYMAKLVSRITRYSGGLELEGSVPKVIALVGPTGVGKTTTIAKLAADVALVGKKNVALFTLDTFRIAATEQLRTYTDILHLPFEIIRSKDELNQKLMEHAQMDLILIDTVGRGAYDTANIHTMAEMFQDSVYPIENHLVLSATTKWRDLVDSLSNFRAFTISNLLFTKLDETKMFGPLFSLAVRTQLPVSYMTYGQNVPEDIEIMSAKMMADLLLRGLLNAASREKIVSLA
ncbi:MAG: flagellar biosynthesis protein FlhF [Candidatus Auribacter fodinae]|jgi:flagellar biosynthesis protein FlhF|uniref:Flagellar biosynthesis protein FlhF n=1 Tax=Candidatus Auribacter fodinae TaxID=2093366 RepID=A0A3A4QXM0_9BACT|nr:MAG: flagellar biosynthesis protein FlhF [Candidatus Auribacter fodinae]